MVGKWERAQSVSLFVGFSGGSWELRVRVRGQEHYFRNYTFYINDLPKINVLHKKSEVKKKSYIFKTDFKEIISLVSLSY